MAMNHAITLGDIIRALGWILAVAFIIIGLLIAFAGGMSDAPAEGDKTSRKGCGLALIGLLFIALLLAACHSPPAAPSDRIIVEKVPIATTPLKASDIPEPPPPLGTRPQSARDAADVALAGWCKAVAFIIRAMPLLALSAGEPPRQAPRYPECEKPR